MTSTVKQNADNAGRGRGFAVVASEGRNLAGRSATAARQIKDLIQDSVKKVEDGLVLVAQSGQTLEQIVSSVKKVSDMNEILSRYQVDALLTTGARAPLRQTPSAPDSHVEAA